MGHSQLALSRAQILAFRRQAGALDQRLPKTAASLRRAAWAGLQDSMPRAALLSIHARVERVDSSAWEHAAFVQLWGPRYNNYVVAAKDLPIFSLGRLADDERGRARADDAASRLHDALDGRRMPFEHIGRALGVNPNSLRYAAPTGRVLMRWDGAKQPTVWTVPAPEMDVGHAQRELARRYLQVFGPATATSFAQWAGVRPAHARSVFEALLRELVALRTPLGDAWILASDEPAFRQRPTPAASARLLPSGDAYYLLWDADRTLLVPNAKRRAALWTTRVWPGALLVNGEIVGTWRRAAAEVTIDVWRRLSREERAAVEVEALSLPLPDLRGAISVNWN